MITKMERDEPQRAVSDHPYTSGQVRGAMLYFDNNASTRPDPRVVEAVAHSMAMLPGNASSSHEPGRGALDAIDCARSRVAATLGANAREIVFTSGATESNNLALGGVARAAARARTSNATRRRMLIGATEHPSVLATAAALRFQGFEVEFIPVDQHGLHDLGFLQETIDDGVLLISIMMANNETGVVSDLPPIIRCAKKVGAVVHCDATQAVGRIPVSFADLGVDLMSLSGHKFHGPKGVGALIVRQGLPLVPGQHGGIHERALRAGTLNTPGIVGLGVAADAVSERLEDAPSLSELRDQLVRRLIESIPDARLVAAGAPRLPNTANMWFPRADAEAVLAGMPMVAASTGAACAAGTPEPSHVLRAMNMNARAASECIRFSLAMDTTQEEVERLAILTEGSVRYVRQVTGDKV